PPASGCITSRLRSSFCIFRIISRRCLRFISCQWCCVGWLVALLFCSSGLDFMLTFLYLIQLGSARLAETTQSRQRGRAVLLFQDNARRHLHNRQNRSHAPRRAGTLQGKCGLSCRARLCLGFYLGHTITGELSKRVSGSYNHRKAVAGAPRQKLLLVRPPPVLG